MLKATAITLRHDLIKNNFASELKKASATVVVEPTYFDAKEKEKRPDITI